MNANAGMDPSAQIHPTAIIEPGAVIGPEARIGPFCVLGAEVRLAAKVELKSHVAIAGRTSIGEATVVWPFASLGHQPQDLKFSGEDSTLEIGARNMIREYVSMNPGTDGGGGRTVIGDGCLFMASAHVGHDCRVGNGVVQAANVPLAGHVQIGDHVILGGNSAVHQHCRIGRGAIVGGMTGVERDVIPYGSVTGDRARLAGLNLIGLKRRGVPRDQIHALRAAYRALFDGEGALAERAAEIAAANADQPLVREIADFILADSARRICIPGDA